MVKFQNTKVADVLKVLSKQLDCQLQFENQQLLSCKYTGNFTNLKPDQIVEAISISFNAAKPTFNTKSKEYSIVGGTCAN